MSSPAPSTTPSRCRPRASRSSAWSSSAGFPVSCSACSAAKAANYKGHADLKGMKIGITAPGSSTHFMVLHLMAQAGLKDDDASFIGVGAGPTAVAAAQARRDRRAGQRRSGDQPPGKRKSHQGRGRHADARRHAGRSIGGPYPAAVLYRHAGLCAEPTEDRAGADQRLRARAAMDREPFGRGDRQGDAAGICARQQGHSSSARSSSSMPMFSPDGRFGRRRRRDRAEGACAKFDPERRARPTIDLSARPTPMPFVDKVARRSQTSMSNEPQIAIDKVSPRLPAAARASRCWRWRTFRSRCSRANSWRCSGRPAAASPRCST